MENFVADAIFIDATPDRVYAALLDPNEVEVWMEAEAVTIDSRPGGSFRVARADGSVLEGTIAVQDVGARLEIGECYRREAGAGHRGPMTLRFVLRPHDGGVWLTVRQEGLDSHPGWQTFAQATRAEWVCATVALKRHVEQI